jgi:SET domain-containing protein
MLLIPTFLAPSTVHGTGLFTEKRIAAFAPIGRFVPGFDQAYTADELRRLPRAARCFLATYCYKSRVTGLYIFHGDNERHVNHAIKGNCIDFLVDGAREPFTIAARDIAAGEELFQNYSEFEDANDPDNIRLALCRTLPTKDPRI